MKERYTLLDKEYCSEELCDLDRDVSEIHDFPEDKDYKKIGPDKHGFVQGTYKVSIVYIPGPGDYLKNE